MRCHMGEVQSLAKRREIDAGPAVHRKAHNKAVSDGALRRRIDPLSFSIHCKNVFLELPLRQVLHRGLCLRHRANQCCQPALWLPACRPFARLPRSRPAFRSGSVGHIRRAPRLCRAFPDYLFRTRRGQRRRHSRGWPCCSCLRLNRRWGVRGSRSSRSALRSRSAVRLLPQERGEGLRLRARAKRAATGACLLRRRPRLLACRHTAAAAAPAGDASPPHSLRRASHPPHHWPTSRVRGCGRSDGQ